MRASGAPVTINRVGSMLTPFFADGPVVDYATATLSDAGAYGPSPARCWTTASTRPRRSSRPGSSGLAHGEAEMRSTPARRWRGRRGRAVRAVLAQEPALAAELVEPAAEAAARPAGRAAADPGPGGRPRPHPGGLPAAPRPPPPPGARRARSRGAGRRLLLRARPGPDRRRRRPLRHRGAGRPDRARRGRRRLGPAARRWRRSGGPPRPRSRRAGRPTPTPSPRACSRPSGGCGSTATRPAWSRSPRGCRPTPGLDEAFGE